MAGYRRNFFTVDSSQFWERTWITVVVKLMLKLKSVSPLTCTTKANSFARNFGVVSCTNPCGMALVFNTHTHTHTTTTTTTTATTTTATTTTTRKRSRFQTLNPYCRPWLCTEESIPSLPWARIHVYKFIINSPYRPLLPLLLLTNTNSSLARRNLRSPWKSEHRCLSHDLLLTQSEAALDSCRQCGRGLDRLHVAAGMSMSGWVATHCHARMFKRSISGSLALAAWCLTVQVLHSWRSTRSLSSVLNKSAPWQYISLVRGWIVKG